MKLGACYNVFDGEELLEASILSIKDNVDYIVIVYQTISNFGQNCDKGLLPLLDRLVQKGLVQELVHYAPKTFSNEEKKTLVSSRATGTDLGGARAEEIADTFFNELTKREIGRMACKNSGCTHFMSMDTDEFYLNDQLKSIKELVTERGYEGVLCKMRYFYKYPTVELIPRDELNYVAVLYEIKENMPFKLGSPYPYLIDPTRKVDGLRLLYACERDELEMYHYSFVRKNISSKLLNVSNRGNYHQNLHSFMEHFSKWKPNEPLHHPHPYFRELFKDSKIVSNYFKIDLGAEFSVP